ncbi:acylneuraminate cytidylyltransferase family protein [Sphingobium ummariense]
MSKNTRPFRADGRSLFQHKMEQLAVLAPSVLEIVISTNDEAVFAQFEEFHYISNARISRRPEELCTSETRLQDLINYVPSIVVADHILWMHATSPFVTGEDYGLALDVYDDQVVHGAKDSLMSVSRLKQFIWNDKLRTIVNCDRAVDPWPHTQDLEPLFEINSAFFISSKQNYQKYQDRIGPNPALYETEGLANVDIDWEEDFVLAQNLLGLFEQVKGQCTIDRSSSTATASSSIPIG